MKTLYQHEDKLISALILNQDKPIIQSLLNALRNKCIYHVDFELNIFNKLIKDFNDVESTELIIFLYNYNDELKIIDNALNKFEEICYKLKI